MRRIKLNVMAAIAAGTLAVSATAFTVSVHAETPLDTSALARTPGATETFASPATTLYTSPDTVAATATSVARILAAEGWQAYSDPFGSKAENPNMEMMSLKKGKQGLSVFVTVAPAQNNATSVSYAAIPISDDLPFLGDATEIKYAPDRPYLSLTTQAPLNAALDTYRTEMTTRGWAAWSRKENREGAPGEDTSEPNDAGKFAFFVRNGSRPLILMIREREGGHRDVTIETVPEKLLTLAGDDELDAGTTAAQKAAAAEAAREANDAFDALAGQIMQDVKRATEEALAGIGEPSVQPRVSVTPAVTDELERLADGDVPVPLPQTAREIDFNGARGDLSFETTSSVRAVAQFYKAAMKEDAWTAERSPIDKETMVVLRFTKGDHDVALTIMKFGDNARVSANGSALVLDAAASAEPRATAETTAPAKAVELHAEEQSGLPVPAPNSLNGTEKTPFRVSVHASVNAPLDAVLTFYRSELSARGWKELEGVSANAQHTTIAFSTPDGPATLTLERKSDETFSTLVLRRESAAREAGLLPKKGHATLLFGNVLEKNAELTVGKKKVQIPAGKGTKKTDGPTLDVAPGKHTYTLRMKGLPPVSEEIDVTEGDIWGLMVGPGGVLALPMY